MSWAGSLSLRYWRQAERTVAHDRHEGPLRVLRSLYPEGQGICHHVLVHPPGGIAGGDTLDVDVSVEHGAHALITTPGATRFYRSKGPAAAQRLSARVAEGARLEWLPLETIVYDAARATNTMRFELAGGAQMIGADLLVLGLPASGEPFRSGHFEQQIELPGLWLERGRLDFERDAEHAALLLNSPLGWAGHRVLGTLWCATGTPWSEGQTQALADAARDAARDATHEAGLGDSAPATAGPLGPSTPLGNPSPPSAPHQNTHKQGLPPQWGVSAMGPQLVVARLLGARTEPLWLTMQAIRQAWRQTMWQLPPCTPRVWRT